MFISKIGFTNFQQRNNVPRQTQLQKNIYFTGRLPKTNAQTTLPETAKKVLLSIAAFAQAIGISAYFIKKGIENDEIELSGNKIDPENEKNKNFVQKFFQSKSQDPTKLSRKAVGKLLGIHLPSVNWHINKGHLIPNEDMTIDITNPINKAFIDNFKKNALTPKAAKTSYTTDEYDELQKRLGYLPLEYCLKHKILIADEKSGTISLEEEHNKKSIELIDNKTITFRNYFLTREEFSKIAGVSKGTISRDLVKKEIVMGKLGIDINHPKNKAYLQKRQEQQKQAPIDTPVTETNENPNLMKISALARYIGCNTSSLQYHIDKGNLLCDPNGFINIATAYNRIFIEKFRKRIAETPRKERSERSMTTDSPILIEGKYITQSALARQLGIAQPTMTYHIQAGNLNYTKGKGIDVKEDTKNIKFIENFQKRKEENNTPKKTRKDVYKKVDFNQIAGTELADMMCLGQTTILYYIDKGQLVRNEYGKIDLNDPTNIEFIKKYEQRSKEAFENMPPENLEKAKTNLKNTLKKRISPEIFDICYLSFEKTIENLKGYIEYNIRNIVNTDDLTPEQFEELYNLFEDIILEEIQYEPLQNPTYFKSDNKLELHTYKYLLDTLHHRKTHGFEPKVHPVAAKATKEDDFDIIDNVIESKAFQDYVKLIKSMLGSKIATLHKLEKTDINQLIETYLYNKFLFIKGEN